MSNGGQDGYIDPIQMAEQEMLRLQEAGPDQSDFEDAALDLEVEQPSGNGVATSGTSKRDAKGKARKTAAKPQRSKAQGKSISDDFDGTDTPSDTVRLVSQDGFAFVLDRDCALGSMTIKNMLSAQLGFSESVTSEIRFGEIRGRVLDKVCQYLCYKHKFQGRPASDAAAFNVPHEMALELLLASDYLQC